MTAEPRFQRAPAALWRIVGDKVLLTRSEWPAFEQLSGSAASIWLMLEDQPTCKELTHFLAYDHDVASDEIELQVGSFVAELEGRGWIERCSL